MAHQAKSLTTVGTGLAVLALAAFSGSAVSASDRLTGATQMEPIVVAQSTKGTKSTKSGTKTKTTKPDRPRKPRGSYSGG